MAKLPKSYIKKYGISKRAWTEFKKSKKRKGGIKTMAKRKVKRRYAKRRSNGGLMNEAVGSAMIVGYDAYLKPMLPVNNNSITGDIIDYGIGYLGKGKSGYLGTGARALRYIAAYRGISRLLSGGTNTGSSNGGMQIIG